MALFILFLIVGLFWFVILFGDLKEGFTNLFEWLVYLVYTVSTYLIIFLIIFLTVLALARDTYRDVEVDKISIVGDSYIIENGNKTESVKSDKFPLEIGKKDFVTYSRITSKKNWYNDFFGFTDESKTKSMSDSEFINGASIVKIGINKENIK